MFSKRHKIISFLVVLLILIICIPFLVNFNLPTSANTNNWKDEFVRMDSFATLFNYLPDNHTLSESAEKPTDEDIEKIEVFLSKYSKKEVNLKADNIILKSYNLQRYNEDILLFSFKTEYKSQFDGSSYITPLVLCLKYSDGTLYYFYRFILGNSHGWIQDKLPNYQSQYSESSLETTRIFIYYLTAIDNLLLTKNSNNYSREITMLYSSYIWLFEFGIID